MNGAAQMTNPNHKTFEEARKLLTGMPGIPDDPRATAHFKSMGGLSEPTAEDMEKGMEAVKFSKTVKVSGVFVETFDLSNPEHVKSYTELYAKLYQKHSEKSLLITDREKRFVSDQDGSRWMIHLEWLEYDLTVKDHQKTRTTGDATRNQQAPVEYRPTDGQ